MKLIKLNSDNYQDALLTQEAYEALRLQMSTGDFHTHKALPIKVKSLVDVDGEVITLGDVLDLTRWSYPDNYSGEDFSEYFIGFAQTRDSCLLDQSNFAVALNELGGESDTVIVARFGHWACGWVQQIMVHESDSKALKILSELKRAYDDYPVLDDSDHSERQSEAYYEYAKQEADSVALVLTRLFGLPEDLETNPLMIELAIELNVEHQSQNGEDSALFNNEYAIDRIDERDLSDYEYALKELSYNLRGQPAFELIAACFGLNLESEA